MPRLEWREEVRRDYPDIWTDEAVAAVEALAPLEPRAPRPDGGTDPAPPRCGRGAPPDRLPRSRGTIPGTGIRVQDARDGNFDGSEIPADLARQWIQGTGPATRPRLAGGRARRAPAQRRLRAALGRRRLDVRRRGRARPGRHDVARQPAQPQAGDRRATRSSCEVAEQVAGEMNAWARGFFGRPIIDDWRAPARLHHASIFRARGLHLDDRHVREADGTGLLGLDRRPRALRGEQPRGACAPRAAPSSSTCPRSRPPRRPRCGTSMLAALEEHLGLPAGTIKVYVLVEQLEASFQLMEIRAALGRALRRLQHRPLGLHQQRLRRARLGSGRSSTPNIDAITMTYGYMRNYEDRVRRAVNTPDRERPLRALAGRHGAEHPGRAPRRASPPA